MAKTQTRRKTAASSANPNAAHDRLIEWLTRIAQHDATGLAVYAPGSDDSAALGKLTAKGEPVKKDKAALDALNLWAFVETVGTQKYAKGQSPLVRLNADGRRKLDEIRDAEAARQAQAIAEQMQSLQGMRDALTQFLQRITELHADGQQMAAQFVEAWPRLVDALVPGAPAANTIEGNGAAIRPAIEALAAAALARIPADHWMDIPDVFERLRRDGVDVMPGVLRDALLILEGRGAIIFNLWMRTLTEIPAPEHGILQPEARVVYSVRRTP